jgi:SHS2 domain-containing protein
VPGKGFRFLAHTADMGIEARAARRDQVLAEMIRGLKTLAFGRSPAQEQVRVRLVVCGDDPVELLVNCLNEVVYWSEKNNMVPAALHVESLAGCELKAILTGEPFDPERHSIERQIKSVTYHQACFEEKPEGWYARVYVDL